MLNGVRRLLAAWVAVVFVRYQPATTSAAAAAAAEAPTDDVDVAFTVPYPLPGRGDGGVELRLLGNKFVLASGALLDPYEDGAAAAAAAASSYDALLSSTSDGVVGDHLVAVDNQPLSSATLSSILNAAISDLPSSRLNSDTHVLPIVAHHAIPSLQQDPSRPPPGNRVLGFVRISTFVPRNMTLRPTHPQRLQALRDAAVEAETRATAARRALEQAARDAAERAELARAAEEAHKRELREAERERASAAAEKRRADLAVAAEKRRADQAAVAEKRKARDEASAKGREAKSEDSSKSRAESAVKLQLRALAEKEAEAAAKDKERIKQDKLRKEEQHKRDKADVLLQLQEPGFEYFDVSFRQKGSLGLWFRPDGSFPPTLDQERTGTKLQPGDTLLAVNKVPLPAKEDGGSMEMLVERLAEAMLPRVLHWRRKLKEEGDDEEKKAAAARLAEQGPLELVIARPRIISGSFPMVKALFGSNDTCTGLVNLTMASPKPDGCSKIKRSSTSDPAGSIVAVLRGVCNFVVKAKTTMAAKALATVVLNSAGANGKMIAMPAGNFKVDDLDGMPVTMSEYRLGDVLRTVAQMARRLKLGAGTMTAFFRGGNSSCPDSVKASTGGSGNGEGASEGSVAVKADGSTSPSTVETGLAGDMAAANAAIVWSRDMSLVPSGVIAMLAGANALKNRGKLNPSSGVLYFWDGVETVGFGAVRAEFGRDVLERADGPIVVKLANPMSGCKGSVGSVRGSIIVVERGECPFVNKAKVAQAQGAKAVLVINTSDDMFGMPAPEEEGGRIKIVVAMLPRMAKTRLQAATLGSEMSLVGRLVFAEKEVDDD